MTEDAEWTPPRARPRAWALCVLGLGVLGCPGEVTAQAGLVQPVPQPVERPRRQPAIRKVGDGAFTINDVIRVDVERREVTVTGHVNDVTTLEFLANAIGGAKAYESALTLDTDAIALNTALLLIGLDPARGRVPERQFDPAPPKGDPVEMHVSWTSVDTAKRVPVEELMLDQRTGRTVKPGPWVYTGSTFVPAPSGHRFLAELDGVLVGMMRGPSALIDNPREDLLGGFGAIVLNMKLGLKEGTPVSLAIRALPR